MIAVNEFLPDLGIFVLGALGGTVLCLMLLWMLRQQKFLHELFLTLRDFEQRNREAQRDLFLILRRHLGFSEIPDNGQTEGGGLEIRRGPPDKGPQTNKESYGLTLDEVRLLVAVATGEESGFKSFAGILKSVKGFYNLESKLRSLREKGFIFYSDLSDVVAILPKGRHYLGLLRS